MTESPETGAGTGAGAGRERRPLWIVSALLLGAAAALWGASQTSWTDGVKGTAAVGPLAVLSLAGIAGTLATSGRPRRAVGVVLALAGLATGWVALDGAFDQGAGLLARVLAVLAGLALIAAGALLVRSGHKMPKLGSGYQTPAAAKAKETPDRELWRALSEGEDPTVR